MNINAKFILGKKTLEYSKILKIPQFLTPEFAGSLQLKIEKCAKENLTSLEFKNGLKFNYWNEENPDGLDYGVLDIFHIEKLLLEILEIDQEGLVQLLKNFTD